MEDYSLLVAGLEYKVRQLIEMKNQLSVESQETREQFANLQSENKQLRKQLEEITRHKQMLDLSETIEGSKDVKKLKLMINEYIREIDKCIAYLKIE
jgi:FtsZ-binding cell division protein ZapB